MVTKSELIDFYHREYEKHSEAAEEDRKILLKTVDEEHAYYHDQGRRENALIASLCKQVVTNLKDMEDESG